ncbi:unnamed protein product [Calypogeia fissa]
MANNLNEKLMGGQNKESNENENNFDALKESLGRISEHWNHKQQLAKHFHAGIAENDTRGQWRKDLAEFLESTPVHVFIVSLLMVDLIATAVDILKTIHNKTSDLDLCTTLLEGCQCVGEFERTESWEFVFWISIVILTVLALNVLLLLLAFGVRFFYHPGYILDAFVVGTALCLEIFLDSETVGLLIILTLWRIVRVAHGIFEVTDEAWEKEISNFKKRLGDAEARHDSDQNLLGEKESRISELEQSLKRI